MQSLHLPLILNVRRSRRLTTWLAIAHLLAGIGLGPTVLPLWGKIAIWLGLLVSLALVVRSPIPDSLVLERDARLLTVDRDPDAGTIEYRVHPATVVLPWLIVLLLESPAGMKTLTLPVDALGEEGHRKLRVWLRWTASGGAA